MDNLPIPQSRIEELMNAFISRDSSQISTPQSRIEEFWYHLIEGTNALPIPQSRIELLLKKIIENDTKQIPLAKSRAEEFLVSILTGDINKLPIPQSRSEYYLDYIARNNLVLDDIEYVKYSDTNITASNTVQKPFRSAILKGQTLVNLLNDELGKPTAFKDYNILSVKENTKYIIFIDLTSPGSPTNTIGFLNEDGSAWRGVVNNVTSGISKHIIETQSGVSNKIRFHPNKTGVNGTINRLMIIEYQEGMENWDIPYFTGMQSVKMPVLTTTGKNLFDGKLEYGAYSSQAGEKIIDNNCIRNVNMIKVQKGSTIYKNKNVAYRMREYREDGTFINTNQLFTSSKLKLSDETAYISFYFLVGDDEEGINSKIILTPSIDTSYEPFKSNILTVNEDVELGSVGEVKDELDLLTGKITQRTDIRPYQESDESDSEVLTDMTNTRYKLAQKVVKTVDLKVVDQDGNPVKQLSAFDETTHIVSSSASDNSLIAIAEVEVPTKLIEALNDVKSLSSDVEMLINEVDNAQKLQDENSTMVMSAMTELYEMVLVMGGGS